MSRITAIKLVKSLSKAEKRKFKLSIKKHSGKKDYLDLFHLIAHNDFKDEKQLEKSFKKLHPLSSIDNTSFYLTKILTESLVESRVKEDPLFLLLHGVMRINILQERNLHQDAFKELKKLQKIAEGAREPYIQFILLRYELNHYSKENFSDISEAYIVEKQMEARDHLKALRNQHEHYSLYELLKYRLSQSGRSLSKEDRNKRNDLLLSEMGIVNARIKSNLESKKLHLLFQSYFFTSIGDYQSALRTFKELNRFFEKNSSILKYPPTDYFSALDGILDSLRTISQFKEMGFYISKLKQLDENKYPEYFRFLIRKTIAVYQLAIIIKNNEHQEAIKYIESSDKNLLKEYKLIDEKKQNELLFYHALAYYKIRKLNKANKYIGRVMMIGTPHYQSLIFKALKLFELIINYELRELNYLDYTIRSYKRTIRNKTTLLKTEKLIFKVIKKDPDFNYKAKNELIWKTLLPDITAIENDSYESQLLKYYNFAGWVKKRFGK